MKTAHAVEFPMDIGQPIRRRRRDLSCLSSNCLGADEQAAKQESLASVIIPPLMLMVGIPTVLWLATKKA